MHVHVTDLKVSDKGHLFSYGSIWNLIFPLIIESLLSIAIGMVDTIMISGYSAEAVSAVSSVDILSQFFIQVFASFATGGAVIVSQYLGRGEKENAQKAAKNLIYLNLFIALFVLFFGLIFKKGIIELVLGKADVLVKRNAVSYFIPVLFSFPFLAIFNSSTAISRSIRKSKRTMTVSLIMNVVNIIGNYLLIYTFDLGAQGAGIATMCSRIIGCLIMLKLMMNKEEDCNLVGIEKVEIDKALSTKIIKMGTPKTLDGFLFHGGKILLQSLIASLGTEALAINAVVMNFNSYANIPGEAVSLAIITLVGFSAGAGRKDEERYYTRVMLSFCILSTLILTSVMFIFTEQFIAIYKLSPTNIKIATPICRLCLIMCTFLWPFSFNLPNTLRATGDIKFTMYISIASMWIFRVLLSFILVKNFSFGVDGVWIGMYADWAFRSVVFLIRYKGHKWQDKNPLR